ncbi:MAG: methylmalonyl-CoA mutase, partial [Acidimicrobiia bacterium]|nr:methylmalonyl-CoA mutase [Acidimicrobiia bacterium]NNL28686.1 methylmalonyl-CoA mutase [Acidimicrobiia bacterium]
LARVKQDRDNDSVRAALKALAAAADDPTVNTMPTMIDAAKAMATEGEIIATLEGVFGTYVESPVL